MTRTCVSVSNTVETPCVVPGVSRLVRPWIDEEEQCPLGEVPIVDEVETMYARTLCSCPSRTGGAADGRLCSVFFVGMLRQIPQFSELPANEGIELFPVVSRKGVLAD